MIKFAEVIYLPDGFRHQNMGVEWTKNKSLLDAFTKQHFLPKKTNLDSKQITQLIMKLSNYNNGQKLLRQWRCSTNHKQYKTLSKDHPGGFRSNYIDKKM